MPEQELKNTFSTIKGPEFDSYNMNIITNPYLQLCN